MEIRRIPLLTYWLIFLLVPALAGATVTRRAHPIHKVKKTRRRVAPKRHVSRFARVRRRVPLHRSFKSTRRRTVAKSRYDHSRRTVARRWHMPGSEIPHSRTEQIQQALIQAGDFHGEPTGQWDSQTREAMKLYQQQNGFQATGLPDAKSLMKMGLGPHPLPLQADPLAQQAQAESGEPAAAPNPSQPPFPPQ